MSKESAVRGRNAVVNEADAFGVGCRYYNVGIVL